MKIVIRVDASTQIGTGHIMRCLALAEALRDKGATVQFICRAITGNLNDHIFSHGFSVHCLPIPDAGCSTDLGTELPPHGSWLEVDWKLDLAQSMNAVKAMTSAADWLIVDHYALDHRWESGMRKGARRIMVIDDLADRTHDCDILLDQNYFDNPESRYVSCVSADCRLLLGPQFALLRLEFAHARQFARHRANRVCRMLVYFGGNDRLNLTGLTLSAILQLGLSDIHVDAVVGAQHSHLKKLQAVVENMPHTRLHIQPDGFVELMLRADLAIGAGGTTTWERLCLNLPSVVITLAENQVPLTEALHKKGYVRWIGEGRIFTPESLGNAIREAMNEIEKNQPDSGPGLVDGLGAPRVAEVIMPSSQEELTLRPAAKNDMETYFCWANDPETRRQSFNQASISWPEHVKWFTQKLSSGDTHMWVMENRQGLPMGQIRFEVTHDAANINYSLDPLIRGRGLAKTIVSQGMHLLWQQVGSIRINALVKVSNPYSCKVFQSLGFIPSKENETLTFNL